MKVSHIDLTVCWLEIFLFVFFKLNAGKTHGTLIRSMRFFEYGLTCFLNVIIISSFFSNVLRKEGALIYILIEHDLHHICRFAN